MSEHENDACAIDVKEWNRMLRPYSTPDAKHSVLQLITTVGLLLASFAAMLAAEAWVGYWAALVFAIPAGLFVVRTFIIQHDCGHYSFFRTRRACDTVGRILGVLTLTPYYWWKRDHDWHHATSGDLTRRGYGDIDTLTVREYRALPGWKRAMYRAYRHPLVLFGLGPLWQFLVRHRLPLHVRGADRKAITSILTTNVALAAFLVICGLALGFGRFFSLWLPIMAVAGACGVWMFFVQHQFERTYWAGSKDWSFVTAALKGCSYYKLPAALEWLTGWIGYHHIHHLASKVPNYRLKDCFANIAALRDAQTVTFRQSLACSRLALWCEEQQRLLSFKDARHAA